MKSVRVALCIAAALATGAFAQDDAPVVDWDIPYVGPKVVSGAVGSTVDFEFQGNIPHNVFSVPTQEAFDACDFSDAEEVCPESNTESTCSVEVKAEKQYLVCTVGSHCASSEQKVIVEALTEANGTTSSPAAAPSATNATTPAPVTGSTSTPTVMNGTQAPVVGNGTAAPSAGTVTLAPSLPGSSEPSASPTQAFVGVIGAAVGKSPCLNANVFATMEEALEASEFCNCTGVHSMGDNGYMIGKTHGQCTVDTVDVMPEGEVRMEVIDENTAGLSGTVSGLQANCMDGVLTINQGFSCNQVLGFDSPGETIYETTYSTSAEGVAMIDMEVTVQDLGFTGPKNIRYLVGLTLSMFGCGVEFPPTVAPTAMPTISPTMNQTTAAPSMTPTTNGTQTPTMSPTPNATTLPPSASDNSTAPTMSPSVNATESSVPTMSPSMNETMPSQPPTPSDSDNNSTEDNSTDSRILQGDDTEMGVSNSSNQSTIAPTPMGSVTPTVSNMSNNGSDVPMFYPRIVCARFLPDDAEISGESFGDVTPPGFPDDVIDTPFAMLIEEGDSSINGTARVDFKTRADSVFEYTLVFTPPVTQAPTVPPTNATTTSAPSMTPVANTSAPTQAQTSAPTNGTNTTEDADTRRVLAEGSVTGFMSVREGSCDDLGPFFQTGSSEANGTTFWQEAFPFELNAENPTASDSQSLFQFAQAVLNQSDYEGLPVVASDKTGEKILACGTLETPPLPRGIIYIYPQVVEEPDSRSLAEGNDSVKTFDVIGQFQGLPEGSTVTIGETEVAVQSDGENQFFAPETTEGTLQEIMQESFVIRDAEGNVLSEGQLEGGVQTSAPTTSTNAPTTTGQTPSPTPTAEAPDNALALGLGLGLGLGIPLVLAIALFTMRSGGEGGAKEPEGKGGYETQEQTGGQTAGTTGQSFDGGVQKA